MFRLSSSSICPFCEASAISRAVRTSWQPCRLASTQQQRRPSRMQLSPNVERGPQRVAPSGKPVKKSRNSPFAAMNTREAPPDLVAAKSKVSTSEQRRNSRYAQGLKTNDRSRDPMKALKMQRALANVSYEKRTRIKREIMATGNFGDFELLPVVKESIAEQALGGLVDISPTPIQRLAIPALLGTEEDQSRGQRERRLSQRKEMQQFLLAAETGSGKTLAYLLPVIDAIKRVEMVQATQEAREAAEKEKEEKSKDALGHMFELEPPSMDEPDPSTARPRAIILVPTSELVEQVGNLVKNISHTVKYRSALLSANYTGTVIRSRLFSKAGIDVVVSTPHLLNSITESDPNILSRVSHLIIDEADSLLDRSFSPVTSSIIDRAAPSLQQLILCSATIPQGLDRYLGRRFPQARRLVTPNLHAIPRRVQLSVVDIDKVPYQGNRDMACAQVIWDIGKEVSAEDEISHGESRGEEKKILVFVNEREKTAELAAYLQSKGISATALSRDSGDRHSADVLASFTGNGVRKPGHSNKTSANISSGPRASAGTPRRTLSNTSVLITTDLTSRGIDTLPVKHVLLYDVPHTSIDFIHRLGRVGRMGKRGRGVVLVGRKDRKDVVKEVREGMFKGQALI